MKSQFLVLSAAAFLMAAPAANAALSESQIYANRIQPRVDRLLRDAGIGPQAQPVSVRATVALDGHVTGVQVLRSSGSRDTDRAIATVLRNVVAADAPVGLLDGAVTLNLAQDGSVLAPAH